MKFYVQLNSVKHIHYHREIQFRENTNRIRNYFFHVKKIIFSSPNTYIFYTFSFLGNVDNSVKPHAKNIPMTDTGVRTGT